MENKLEFKIGGEFEIDPDLQKKAEKYKNSRSTAMISNGRNALQYILSIIKKQELTLYLPYYICKSVVAAVKKSKVSIQFYELDETFLIPRELINNLKPHSALLSINYFGIVDDSDRILEIKNLRPDIIIIGDNVQSLWTCASSQAHYSFTSLRKQIAAPDGSLIFKGGQRLEVGSEYEENGFFKSKLAGSISKFNQENENFYLSKFNEGENLLDEEKEITKASQISEFILDHLDYQKIILQRQKNYQIVYELGNEYGFDFIFDYSKHAIPLCVPISLKNRDFIRKQLIQNNIFLPIHWNISDYNSKSKIAQNMSQNSLSLVIDQRYSIEEIKKEVEIVATYIK